MKKKRKYEGILAQPMGAGDGDDAYWERVVALAKHYDVDLAGELGRFKLALALAQDHVPGFQFQKQEMTIKKAQIGARDLMLAVEMSIRINKGLSANRASEIVSKARPELGLTAQALRQRFMSLSNLNGPDRGGARANLFRVLLMSTGPQWGAAEKRALYNVPAIKRLLGNDLNLRALIMGKPK